MPCWVRKSLSSSLVPFISTAKTSFDAWTSLHRNHAMPTRGSMMNIYGLLDHLNKGNKTITEYMQHANSLSGTLSLMNVVPIAPDCLTDKILARPW